MKNVDRLQELNNCLLKKSFQVNYQTFSHHLAENYDVHQYAERSFNRDIKELKERVSIRFPHLEIEYGSLIKYSRSGNYFYYVRNDISAFPGFSEKELSQIAVSIEQNKHLFTDGLGQGILQKLLAIGLENRLSRFHHDIKWPALQLIKDGERSGSQWLKVLLEKIYRQEVVEFEHIGLKKSSGMKRVKGLPLLIKEYNNGWYTGWYVLFYPIVSDSKLIRPQLSDLWCFALDRIVGLKEVATNYQIRLHEDFRPSQYFENMMGVFREDTVGQKVVLRLSKDSWLRKYLEKYPIHPSQNNTIESDIFRVELRIMITTDFENFIFQYSDEVFVEQPLDLREKIRDRLEKAIHLKY